MKILIAEDTTDMNRVLTVALEHSGYMVDSAFDGEEAEILIQKNGYDLIILDIMMPKKDGLEVLSGVRSKGIITPVLMLTAKAEIDDRVAGLDAGADDYLTKPFAIKELLARVRAMLRRKTEYASEDLTYGDLQLNGGTLELRCENSVRLSAKEFDLLQVLIRNTGKSLDSRFILENVWGDSPQAKEDTVRLYINYLRSKLRAIASSVTITGEKDTGYHLEI